MEGTKEIAYIVKEIKGFAPLINQDPEGVAPDGAITNKEGTLDLEIQKVDKADYESKLKGATFEIHRIDGETVPDTSIKHVEGKKFDPVTTGDDGKTSFKGTPYGYYEIEETGLPAGYVMNEENRFYIKVGSEGVKLIEKDLTKAPKDWRSISKGGIVSQLIPAKEEMPAQAVVENTAGAALPNAGGPGTYGFYLTGFLLAFLGFMGLSHIRLRRARGNN